MKNNRTFLEKLLDGAEVEWKTIAEISNKVSSGGTPTTSNNNYYENGNIPWLRTQEVDFKEIWNTDLKITEEGLNNSSAKWIPKNCVIVAMYGATVGKIAINKIPLTTNQACANIEVNPEIAHYRYVFHYLMSKYEYIKSLGSGSQTNINSQIVKKIRIPIPPLPVQIEIVKILDALTALTSELTSELTLRRKQYEHYREKLLSEEELGKVGFEWKTLGDVAKIQRGASPRPISQYITDEPNGIPWIKIGDTSLDSKYIENTAQKITVEGAEKSRILKCGDFVMSNSMSYGRPYILKISGAIHDGWASISDFENILNSDFLYYYLSSDSVQSYWNGKINSSSVSNLNSDIIKSLPIPIPALHIQIEIAKTLDKFETLINSISKGLPLAIEQSQKRYEYYRELLLNFS